MIRSLPLRLVILGTTPVRGGYYRSPLTGEMSQRDRGVNFLLLLFLTFSFAIQDVETKLSKQAMTLGEPFVYQVRFISKNTPNIEIDPNDDIFIMSSNINQESDQFLLTYYMAAFNVGLLYLPTINIMAVPESVVVRPEKIVVESAFEENETKNFVLSLKPQLKMKLKWWNYLLLLCVCAAVAAFAVFIIRLIKKDETIVFQKERGMSPIEITNELFNKLTESKLWETDIKAFYFQLSYIVKNYLTLRFEVNILESTTNELRGIVKKLQIPEGQINNINSFFMTIDPVKYANVTVTINEAKGMIDQARIIVGDIERYVMSKEERQDDIT